MAAVSAAPSETLVDVAFELADCAVGTSFDNLPLATVRATEAFIVDALAVAVAGSSAAGIDAGVELARSNGGAEQATLLVFGDRFPATAVAMINGTMMQARDFDAVYEPGVLLPYAPVLAAALATAELTGADGARVLNAVVLGADHTCRLGRALTKGLGWSRTATLGVFGAAIAAARLLELSREQMVSALGLALSQCSGNIQTVIDGSLAKRYQAGFVAEAGVRSALLAQRGVTGPANVFEGRCGFFALYEGGSYHRERITHDLGSDFQGVQASIKPYPCARELHGAIAAALDLHVRGVRAEDVRSVTVRLPPNAFALSGKPFPRSGATLATAIGNAAYGVAVGLQQGVVSLDDFEPPALLRCDVLALIERIDVVEDRSVIDARTLVPQTVEVTLRDGRVLESTCSVMPGAPERPLSDEQRRAKLAACMTHAARPMGDDPVAALERAVQTLHRSRDIGGLLEAVTSSARQERAHVPGRAPAKDFS
jgi:2-methylcitrate dehydratase PrpD